MEGPVYLTQPSADYYGAPQLYSPLPSAIPSTPGVTHRATVATGEGGGRC